MRFWKILVFAIIFTALILAGCTVPQQSQANRDICNTLNQEYGSFSGTACAWQLNQKHFAELAQLKQSDNASWTALNDSLRTTRTIISFSCNPTNLENGPKLQQGITCTDICVQNQNTASCQATVVPPDTAPTLSELLDFWDASGIPIKTLNAFCSALEGTKGQTAHVQPNGLFLYDSWTMATVCDPRTGKENVQVEIKCTLPQTNPDKYNYDYSYLVQYKTLAQKCTTGVNPPTDQNQPVETSAECTTVSGEKGLTGEAALPKMRFYWNWGEAENQLPENACETIYCDPVQFTITLMKKLHDVSGNSNPQISSFTANLIGDSFNSSFLQDFANDQEFLQAPSWFDSGTTALNKYLLQDKIKFSPETISSGKYQVSVEISSANTMKGLFTNIGEPNAAITIKLEKISEPAEKNPFYFLPINGNIGTTNGRNGYGTRFDNTTTQIQITDGYFTKSNTGSKTAMASTITDFELLNSGNTRGLALELSQLSSSTNSFTLNLYNGAPVPVLGVFDSTKAKSGLSYNLLQYSEHFLIGIDNATSWQAFASDKGCKDIWGNDLPYYNFDSKQQNCGDSLANSFQVAQATSTAGKMFYSTIFYKPSNAYLSLQTCAQGSIFATAKTNTEQTGPLPLENNIAEQASSIQQVFDLVKQEKICVVNKNNDTKYFWNEKALEKTVQAKAPSYGSVACGSQANLCGNDVCTAGEICNPAILQCIVPVCQKDSDCDDRKENTKDICHKGDVFFADGHFGADCQHTPQLIGDQNIKLLIVEFAPKGTNYGTLILCYNSAAGYSLTTNREFCSSAIWDTIITTYNFLDIRNAPSGQIQLPFTPWNGKAPYSFFYINDYLQKEAKKYSINNIPKFDITILGPFELTDLPPKMPSDVLTIEDYFSKKINEQGIDTSKYDIVAVVYFDDQGLILSIDPNGANPVFQTEDRHGFVNHAVGPNTVYLSLKIGRINEDQGTQTLIHEILHLFGASDTYVQGEPVETSPPWCHMFQCCTLDGVPNPNQFPQTEGCIMCAGGGIVIDYGKEGQASNSMDKVIVCNKTAQEIGWKTS